MSDQMEPASHWLREALPPRSENVNSMPFEPESSCPICEGRGFISVQADKFRPWSTTVVMCICQKDSALRRHIDRFNALPNPGLALMTFDTWRPVHRTEEALASAYALAEGTASCGILVISGAFGNGKTHLLAATINHLTSRLQFARYRYVPQLLDELRATYDQDYEGPKAASLLESYGSHGFLALDDLGAGKEKPSEWSIEQMETIINSRYESQRGLIVSTNLSARELASRWSPRIADRLFDWRTGKAKQVIIDAPSYRTGQTW